MVFNFIVKSSSSALVVLLNILLGLILFGGAGIMEVSRSDKSFKNGLIQNKI